ncbi:MAG: hypothetical protein IPK53_10260 [bacterium]|nr:hypothetical protein [bacterium]
MFNSHQLALETPLSLTILNPGIVTLKGERWHSSFLELLRLKGLFAQPIKKVQSSDSMSEIGYSFWLLHKLINIQNPRNLMEIAMALKTSSLIFPSANYTKSDEKPAAGKLQKFYPH